MTLDERLEAITMNLELAYRDIQDLRDMTVRNAAAIERNAATNAASIEALQTLVRTVAAAVQKNSEAIFELGIHGDAQRERIDILVTTSSNLLAICQAHQNRIERLERKSA
jgi:hypothetical protein